jgi:hypothetical protein
MEFGLVLRDSGKPYFSIVNFAIFRYIFLNNELYSHKIWYTYIYGFSVSTDDSDSSTIIHISYDLSSQTPTFSTF